MLHMAANLEALKAYGQEVTRIGDEIHEQGQTLIIDTVMAGVFQNFSSITQGLSSYLIDGEAEFFPRVKTPAVLIDQPVPEFPRAVVPLPEIFIEVFPATVPPVNAKSPAACPAIFVWSPVFEPDNPIAPGPRVKAEVFPESP